MNVCSDDLLYMTEAELSALYWLAKKFGRGAGAGGSDEVKTALAALVGEETDEALEVMRKYLYDSWLGNNY